jgi:hypothetical protein
MWPTGNMAVTSKLRMPFVNVRAIRAKKSARKKTGPDQLLIRPRRYFSEPANRAGRFLVKVNQSTSNDSELPHEADIPETERGVVGAFGGVSRVAFDGGLIASGGLIADRNATVNRGAIVTAAATVVATASAVAAVRTAATVAAVATTTMATTVATATAATVATAVATSTATAPATTVATAVATTTATTVTATTTATTATAAVTAVAATTKQPGLSRVIAPQQSDAHHREEDRDAEDQCSIHSTSPPTNRYRSVRDSQTSAILQPCPPERRPANRGKQRSAVLSSHRFNPYGCPV